MVRLLSRYLRVYFFLFSFKNHLELVSFKPRIPWTVNGTLKENICFGKNYDETFYENVIRLCHLDESTFKKSDTNFEPIVRHLIYLE